VAALSVSKVKEEFNSNFFLKIIFVLVNRIFLHKYLFWLSQQGYGGKNGAKLKILNFILK